MRVFLAGGDPEADSPGVESLRRLAAGDGVGRHTVVDAPGAADLILLCDSHLFEDWSMRRMREHPLAQRYGDKTYIYCERDDPFCVLPGLYVSMPQRAFDPRLQVASPYQRTEDLRLAAGPAAGREPDLLFSFIGGRTHRCRDPLLEMHEPDAIVESPVGFVFYDPASTDFAARREHFLTRRCDPASCCARAARAPRRSGCSRRWPRDGCR